jgi:hypothetical protein
VVHACTPSTQEAEGGTKQDPLLKNQNNEDNGNSNNNNKSSVVSLMKQTKYAEVHRKRQDHKSPLFWGYIWVFPENASMVTVTIRFSWIHLEIKI